MAAARGTTARQVALRFLVRRHSVLTIPKSANVEHTAENAGAGALRLAAREFARIDHAFPRRRRPPVLPTI